MSSLKIWSIRVDSRDPGCESGIVAVWNSCGSCDKEMERLTKALDDWNKARKYLIYHQILDYPIGRKFEKIIDGICELISEEQENNLCIHVYDTDTNAQYKYTFCYDIPSDEYEIISGECHH